MLGLVLRPLLALRRTKWLWLWPGLWSLWVRGSWRSLALAIVSAWMLSGLLAVTWVWTDLATASMRGGGWIGVVAIWSASAIWSWQAEKKNERSAASADDQSHGKDLFSAALGEYLKGDYLEAERQLRPLITANPSDAEARLLLATLLRRAGRTDEAREELRRLVKIETAATWSREIQREQAMVQQTITEQAITQQQTTTDESNKNNNSDKNHQDTSADMTKAA